MRDNIIGLVLILIGWYTLRDTIKYDDKTNPFYDNRKLQGIGGGIGFIVIGIILFFGFSKLK